MHPQATPALVPYDGDRFLARRRFWSFLGPEFHIYGADGGLRFFVKQKAFKLKEAITVFADEARQQPMLQIQARGVLDFSATYDVTTVDGERVGSLRRKGIKSLLQDDWDILDATGQIIGRIHEDSPLLALLRRFLSNLIPQSFHLFVRDQPVAIFKQHFNPFLAKMDLDFTPDAGGLLDRRLGIAAVVLLMAIEGRQD